MEATPDQLSPDQLYDQAIAFFRAARWDEAIGALRQLQAQSSLYPEADALLADIQLKQGMERHAQEPTAAEPPRERSGGRRKIALAALALVTLGLVGGLRALALFSADGSLSLPQAASRQAVIGALPTPAPSPVAEFAASAGEGVLMVSMADSSANVENIYFVLDASGSMLARIDGQRKIVIARQAMGALMQDLSDTTHVALRTYGRNRPDDCSDIELLSPLAPLDRETLIAQIDAIEPVNLSRTPIASSLAAIAADLGDASGETLVVLLSDGEESCDGDPVAEAAKLHADNPQVRVSVVGLDIAPDLTERLAAIAEAGGGTYFAADDVNQLGAALKQALALRYRVLDERGDLVGSGEVGHSLNLPAGDYRVLIGGSPPQLDQAFDIRQGMATVLDLNSDRGQLQATLRRDWAP